VTPNEKITPIKMAVPCIGTQRTHVPTKKFDNIQRRIEHAPRHMKGMKAMYTDDEILGVIGWCVTD